MQTVASMLAVLLMPSPFILAVTFDAQTMPGGEGTMIVRGVDAYSHPARNSTLKHRRRFVVGNSLFKENWVKAPSSLSSRQGLGPLFNAQSCSSCHFKDGRGRPPEHATEPFQSMLVRLSIPGHDQHGGPMPVPDYGDQLNHRSVAGVIPEGDVRVSYDLINGAYPDGSSYSLMSPRYSFTELRFGPLPQDVMVSPRVAPALIGLGLLEAVSEETILAMADPDDRNHDGIRGRANMVWDIKTQQRRLGRFGWKANQPSLEQQNAGAFAGDMGISSHLFPASGCAEKALDCQKEAALTTGYDISGQRLADVTAYTKLLAVPAWRNVFDPEVVAGAKNFQRIGCEGCHVPRLKTGIDPLFPENSGQTIAPYTDLLVHDMGEGLADRRSDYEADGRSWRTPPLWGIGLLSEVNSHTRLLHDGRARNIEEAILWHHGEAEAAQLAFQKLSQKERSQIIKFVESL